MDINTQKIYAEALEMFIDAISEQIESQVDDWLDENPYYEIDDEDCFGNRTFHYPKTSRSDAIEHLSEDLINAYAYADIGDCDFMEFVVHQATGYPLSKDNKYKCLIDNKRRPGNIPPRNTAPSLASQPKRADDTAAQDIINHFLKGFSVNMDRARIQNISEE